MCAKVLTRLLLLLSLVPSIALALPWDTDLNSQQSFKPSEFARAPVVGTVPLGSKPFTMTLEEAEAKLQNPVAFTLSSVWRGQRLWNSNCYTCHGKLGNGTGPVGPQMAVPDLLTDFYRGKSDGRVFGILHYGGTNMPRYGYKFSEAEKWDVINYLRFLQGRNLSGADAEKFKRPE